MIESMYLFNQYNLILCAFKIFGIHKYLLTSVMQNNSSIDKNLKDFEALL